jgi:probable F420-dependent oxidoreductase
VKFGIMYANAGPSARTEHATALATLAEEAAFESLWTVEHVVVPAGYQSTYPYSGDGRMPGGEDVDIPDPLVWLAWVAAKTTRIRLATGILILPQRNPLIVAKEVATLDRLSGGRMTLGVGVGWLREEFDALGVPFERRGARADEYVAAMRAAWTEDEPTYEGRFVSFTGAKSNPRPVQAGGVPVVVGGHSEGASATGSSRGRGATTRRPRWWRSCARRPRRRAAIPMRSRSRQAGRSTSRRCGATPTWAWPA